ncbi:hypothetical protein SAMD00019534_017440 [Acytostelium subglobosum LB1]|uniref:hypothetical protein n=1 Tax=Acytostelium subglobosum LB1 TaxID=1410327 RepID=UPI0006448BCC|nr:hypothetical protein SAMD00019534_017440 [Acytostelium subglobosum LB1]GAM18569.1 hypothetical protein SAMD00019534_017440 [Acytostelium subglobosum LB1]|eukprot:XP_012757789.1 hypothetical protein SAMD00019534_017440 [Acytostelium subglobosum LB1]
MEDKSNVPMVQPQGIVNVPEGRVLTGEDIDTFKIYPDHDKVVLESSREDLKVPKSIAFLVNDLMSREECAFYIEESLRKGYVTIEKEFPKEYRNNTRTLGKSKTLSAILWSRLQRHIRMEELEGIRPYGFDQEGVWIPVELDDCFTFGRYEPGGRFKPHLDATYAESPDRRSIFTMQIYLNDDYEGGKTNFFLPANPLEVDKHVLSASVTPKTGMAVLFNHDTLHEGAMVDKGVKYIMRVDMMFLRIDKGYRLMSDENKAKMMRARELFFKADSLEKDDGDLEAAIATYVDAQMLLAALPSIEEDTKPTTSTPDATSTSTSTTTTSTGKRPKTPPTPRQLTIFDIPEYILNDMLVTLNMKDLCSFRGSCKEYLKTCSKNSLWKNVYIKLFSYEAFKFEEPNAVLLDKPKTKLSFGSMMKRFSRVEVTLDPRCWYLTVQNVYAALVQHHFLFFDVGREFTKFCDHSSVYKMIPTRASVHYEYAPHYAMSSLDRESWSVGYNASYSSYQQPIASGLFEPNRLQCLNEIIKHCMTNEVSRRYRATAPYILCLAPPMIGNVEQIRFLGSLRTKQHNDYVQYKAAALCVLQGFGLDTGVVVMCGANTTFIVTVAKTRQLAYTAYPVHGGTVTEYLTTKFKEYGAPADAAHLFAPAKVRYGGTQGNMELIPEWYKQCRVSMNYKVDASKSSIGAAMQYTAAELMFDPSLKNINSVSLVEMTADMVTKSEAKDLLKHVVITGGNSVIPNFVERFTRDFHVLMPDIEVLASDDRMNDVLKGAKVDQALSKSLHADMNTHIKQPILKKKK